MEAVKAINLTKKYAPPKGLKRLMVKSPLKQEITAVNDVCLSIGRGELFGLIGPNGAGKTTLIKMLATLLLPTSGRALVNGFDVADQESAVKASIGFVSGEERSFYWRLTGRENLLFFCALHNIEPQKARPKIDEVLKIMRLDSAADNMYYSYSTGMKQKLLIARGLLTDPQVLFLDEPTRSVDAVTAQEIKALIRDRIVKEEGRTVVLTSHRLEEIEAMCYRIAIMNDGKITFIGPINNLRAEMNQRDRYTFEIKHFTSDQYENVNRVFGLDSTLTSNNGSNIHKLEFYFTSGANNISAVIQNIIENGGEIISLNRRQSTLEDMFVEYLRRRN